TAGTYSVIMEIFSGEKSGAFLTLTHPIVVSGEGPDPEDPEPEDPEPVDPLQCTVEGQQRQIEGEIKSEEKECGIDGKRTASYREVVTEECRLIGEFLRWTEVSRTRRELDPGQCQDQACEVPSEALLGRDGSSLGFILVNGVFYLPSGESRTFYSTTAPAGACAQVSQARSCKNGVLSGSTSHVHLSCNSGCEGVGVHGSTVKGVVTGQEQVAHRCAYNETGIFDTFQVVADKSCNNGQVVTANARRGSLITAGVCPTYNWVATESYTACDQNCGGQQTQIFECRDNKGAPAPQARCQDQGSAPVVKRVCDGNPEAVRRTESNTTIEEAGASAKCPRNQIGVVVQRREVTRIQAFACINHQVAKESDKTSYGPWVQENQCRDLVPHRCSGDSLSPQGASARLRWMLKCRQDVPAIDEFLKIMDGYMGTWNRSPELIVNGRIVYPTFLDSTSSPPRRWTAPVNDRVGCDVPSTVYVAAVCVASCATPEQQILAHNGERGKIEYVPIYDAWHDRFKHVATLTRQSTLESRHVQRTAVENWVAELQDETHEIMEFTMASGGKLSLTTNHPVLTPEGTMKLASDFQVGESLVRLGGQLDPIVQLERTSYVGKVYNVFVKSAELRENVVVTNGYLNGTAYFQNEGAKDLNRQLFRRQLIRGAFDK
ncbi:MAG: Hint domain-containing protein, partial [Bdellovibrionales bacterium]